MRLATFWTLSEEHHRNPAVTRHNCGHVRRDVFRVFEKHWRLFAGENYLDRCHGGTRCGCEYVLNTVQTYGVRATLSRKIFQFVRFVCKCMTCNNLSECTFLSRAFQHLSICSNSKRRTGAISYSASIASTATMKSAKVFLFIVQRDRPPDNPSGLEDTESASDYARAVDCSVKRRARRAAPDAYVFASLASTTA